MPNIIEKKTWPDYFEKVLSGEKTYELRIADFKCEPGDTLVLKEWCPNKQDYTGREIVRTAGYVGKVDVTQNEFWDQKDIENHGYQLISLLPPSE